MLDSNTNKNSIKQQIRLLLFKVMALSFLVIYSMLIVQKTYESIRVEREQAQMLVNVIASSVKASLLSENALSAQQTLDALISSTSVHYVALKDINGDVFAVFGRPDFTPDYWKYIELSQSVKRGDDILGELIFVSSLTKMWQAIRHELMSLAVVIFFSLLISVILIRRLATKIITPIKNLVDTSRDISQTGRYDLRTEKVSNNELGVLADTFNNMLSLIERRDDELRIAATTFNSQEAIIITDDEKRVIKVNPAYSNITGYQLADIEGFPPSFLNSKYQDHDVYDKIYTCLEQYDQWAGELVDEYKDGRSFHGSYMITAVRNTDETVTHYVINFTDISERVEAEDKIRNLAFYDPLTHLPNRRLLLDRLDSALKSCVRSKEFGALIFLDLDKFKLLNDSKGHGVGDMLLIEVANRLLLLVREQDTVARLGGDEYVVMLQKLGTDRHEAAAHADTVAHKIVVELNKPYLLDDYPHVSSSSVGVTLFSDDANDVEAILLQADMAMYSAKHAGRNTSHFFDASMQKEIEEKVQEESKLRQALILQQFELYYQIIVDSEEQPIGAEALIRWHHPDKGIIGPASFIPLAEEIGIIDKIGDWVIRTACQQLRLWQLSTYTRQLMLTINVSAMEFRRPRFADNVLEAVDVFGINPKKLKIELTESVILDNIDFAVTQLTYLKKSGISTAMDDFGTGYSSLNYLSQLPVSTVKIDRSFIARTSHSSHDRSIVSMITTLGQMLGKDIVAEGIETQQQYDLLKAMGCSSYQGFLFSDPVAISEFEILVKNKYLAHHSTSVKLG